MTPAELEAWLIVTRLPGIGPYRFNEILKKFDSPANYLRRQRPRTQGLGPLVAADLEWAQQPNCHILTRKHKGYPTLLNAIDDPPPLLFVQGQLDALHQPQVAIVGSRKPTNQGGDNAFEFAALLAATGLTITSGLATGIDTRAHEGALLAKGRTIAVMATGPEQRYPTVNTTLAERIIANGALVTEMPVGTKTSPGLFPRRNRIISGLSAVILVIEAGISSGALGTAKQALEQNREVMAMPGSVHNPVARGCHSLIKSGASLIETATDVLNVLKCRETLCEPAEWNDDQSTAKPIDPDLQAVLDAIGHDPVTFDGLVARLGLTPDRLSSMLLNLELLGLVIPTDGGRYERSNQRTGG